MHSHKHYSEVAEWDMILGQNILSISTLSSPEVFLCGGGGNLSGTQLRYLPPYMKW